MHGGKSLKGFAHPRFKDGSRSKYLKHLPESKQLRFDDNADPEGVPSVSEELNLARLHLQEVLEMLADSTLFDNWQSIRAAVRELEEIVLSPNEFEDLQGFGFEKTPEMLFQRIDELFTKNAEAIRTWNVVHDLNERIRKMEETNSKLRLQNLEEDTERSKLVPVEVFSKFVLEAGKQFELSPPEIRKTQLYGLAVAFDALPRIIRESKQLTD